MAAPFLVARSCLWFMPDREQISPVMANLHKPGELSIPIAGLPGNLRKPAVFLRVFYEADPVKPLLTAVFPFSSLHQDRGQAGRRSWAAVGGENISAAGRRPSSLCCWFFLTARRVRAGRRVSTFYSGCRAFAFARAAFNCIRRTGPILCDSIHFSKTRIRLPVPCSSASSPLQCGNQRLFQLL